MVLRATTISDKLLIRVHCRKSLHGYKKQGIYLPSYDLCMVKDTKHTDFYACLGAATRRRPAMGRFLCQEKYKEEGLSSVT